MSRISALIVAVLAVAPASAAEKGEKSAADEAGFVQLFNGTDYTGWKIGGPESSWSIHDGALVAKGGCSHCFYVGDPKPFKDFHLKVDVMTGPNSNGGIYFHTKYQPSSWPKNGFEVQVNNSHGDPIRSGSLYQVSNVKEKHVNDNEWYTTDVTVKGKHVVVKLNDTVVTDYTEPADKPAGKDFTRKLDEGTFALQAHDPGSVVKYKNIRVKRLE